MSKIILYGVNASPPVRAVLLALNALEVPYEYKVLNWQEQENKSAEYRKINPMGTVPTLVDAGHSITDSHAIISYLASKYGKDDSLYPKDLVKRSIVDQRLYYDTGVAFERAARGTTMPILFNNKTEVPQSQIDIIADVYASVNGFLKDQPYVAGDHLTIADFSFISTISSLQTYLDIDAAKYPNLLAWFKRIQKLPYYEKANGIGAKQFFDLIKSKNIKIVP